MTGPVIRGRASRTPLPIADRLSRLECVDGVGPSAELFEFERRRGMEQAIVDERSFDPGGEVEE